MVGEHLGDLRRLSPLLTNREGLTLFSHSSKDRQKKEYIKYTRKLYETECEGEAETFDWNIQRKKIKQKEWRERKKIRF